MWKQKTAFDAFFLLFLLGAPELLRFLPQGPVQRHGQRENFTIAVGTPFLLFLSDLKAYF